jgi:hypothetical protein
LNAERWQRTFDYIRSRPELEDIVISGGDAFQLRPEQITQIGETLLSIDHVRRMRYATKGPAVMPQKILTDDAWTDALTGVVEQGRTLHKEVVLTPTSTTRARSRDHQGARWTSCASAASPCATRACCSGGERQLDDDDAAGQRLGYVNVHPYYIYMHDLVKGVEDLRTTLQTGLDIEKGSAARRPASTRRRGRRRARAAAASATRTRTSTTTARRASRCSRRPPFIPARCTSTSIRSTSCPPKARPAGPTRPAREDGRRSPRRG